MLEIRTVGASEHVMFLSPGRKALENIYLQGKYTVVFIFTTCSLKKKKNHFNSCGSYLFHEDGLNFASLHMFIHTVSETGAPRPPITSNLYNKQVKNKPPMLTENDNGSK